MREIEKIILFWSPRILAILFAFFLSLFAADVFSENLDFWQKITALFIHLIPSLLILVLLSIAWRWEIVGTLSYFLLAIWYIASSWGRFPLSVYVVITAPLFVISILFLINWFYHDELHYKN